MEHMSIYRITAARPESFVRATSGTLAPCADGCRRRIHARPSRWCTSSPPRRASSRFSTRSVPVRAVLAATLTRAGDRDLPMFRERFQVEPTNIGTNRV
jgi:hypothetical protein